MHLSRTILVTACLATSGIGQNLLAFPQDSTRTIAGNRIALGFASYGQRTQEVRYQMVITAEHLPAPGSVITGLEAWATTGAPANYPKFEITIGHLNRTTLDPTFANNLQSAVLVASLQNISVNWISQQWVPITFQRPFVYDGTSNLVIELSRTVTPDPTIIYLGHGTTDHDGTVRQAAYAAGVPGSGAANAPTIQNYTDPLCLRLHVSSPTLLLRSDPPGLGQLPFTIGNSFDVEVRSRPGTTHAVLGSAGFGAATRVPPLGGLSYINLAGAVTLATGTVPNTGIANFRLAVPNLPGLVGTRLVFQAPALRPGGLPVWTNATNCVIQM